MDNISKSSGQILLKKRKYEPKQIDKETNDYDYDDNDDEQKPKKQKIEEIMRLVVPTENGCLVIDGKLPLNLLERYAKDGEDFEKIWALKPKEPGKVMIYGKITTVPRWQQSFIKDYHFSGLNHIAIKNVPEIIKPIYDWVQSSIYANDSDGPFNQLLINGYLDGSEYISAHSDDEKQLKPKSCILSISLGETRKFRISGKMDNKKVIDYNLSHGDVIVMKGEMQHLYKHAIVKVSGSKGKNMGRRINLTFRKFK